HDRHDIGRAKRQVVGGGGVRLVAQAMPARVHEDQLMIALQPLDIAAIDPVRAAAEGAVMKNERRPMANGLIMDAHAPVVRECHGCSPDQSRGVWAAWCATSIETAPPKGPSTPFAALARSQ